MSLDAAAAFLTGVSSVVTAGYAIRRITRRLDAECEKRFAAFREGLSVGRER